MDDRGIRDIPGLTGLRGFAAVWVCIFHYTYINDFGPFLTPIAKNGHEGVIVFFVLSGFIMMHVYGRAFAEGSAKFVAFQWHRLARIYPLYLFALCAVAMMMACGLMPYGTRDTPKTFALNLVMAQAWGIINENTWNLPAWSISTEFACYLIFPLVAGFLYRRSMWWSATAIAALFFIWKKNYMIRGIVSAVQAAGRPYGEGIVFLYGGSLSSFIMTFLAGAALYQIARRSKWSAEVADAIMLAGVVWMIGTCVNGSVTHMSSSFGAILIVIGLYRDAGVGRLIFGNKVAVWLGKVSYALYLSHIALIHLWVWALRGHATAFHQLPLTVRLLVALAFAALLHYAIELPARRALRNLTVRAPAAGKTA